MIFAQDPKRLVQYRFECYDRHRIMLAVHLCWSGIMCTVWTFVCMRSNVSNIVDCAVLGWDWTALCHHFIAEVGSAPLCRLAPLYQDGPTIPSWPHPSTCPQSRPSYNLLYHTFATHFYSLVHFNSPFGSHQFFTWSFSSLGPQYICLQG